MRQLNKRDRKGWRIPRTGTISRQIYDAINEGKTPTEIGRLLGMDPQTVRVLSHKFRNPEVANAWSAKK